MKHRRSALRAASGTGAAEVAPGAGAVRAVVRAPDVPDAAGGAADAAGVAGTPCAPGGVDAPGASATAGAPAAAGPPRWLALHLPRLSLEAFCSTLTPDAAGRPVALLQAQRVQHVNAAAAQAGVRPGMTRAAALALAADLLPAAADPARDAAALQAVVHAALAFTPQVTLEHDAAGAPTVLLELRASLRLFGGWPRLLQRLQRALAPLGHQMQHAAAPTPLGAALLARAAAVRLPGARRGADAGACAGLGADRGADAGVALDPRAAVSSCVSPAVSAAAPSFASPGADPNAQPPRAPASHPLLHGPQLQSLAALARLLDRLPPWALPAGAAQHAALQAMGLTTLAALRRLPRDGLARRFGPALLHDWDRALGRRPDPRLPLQPPEVFESRLELHTRAEHTDQVLAAAAVLLARLVAWAQGRQVRLRAFTLRMLHERSRRADDTPHPPTVLRVELAEPALDPAHLQLLLRERLARCRLVAPTLELHLHCHEVATGGAPNAELFPTRQGEAEGLLRLLERLRARLGDAAVLQVQPQPDHRPERAQHEVPARALPQPAPPPPQQQHPPGRPWAVSAPPAPPLPLPRPVWLLPDPMPLAERDGQPLLDGRPLRLLLGPERIETGWWDGEPAARDYYVATDAAAPGCALVWIWRSRLPGPQGEMPWYLQGRFG